MSHDGRGVNPDSGAPAMQASDTDTGTGTAPSNDIEDSTRGEQQWQQLISFSQFLSRLAAAQEGASGNPGQLGSDGSFPDLTTFGYVIQDTGTR
eukprot:TRINITY_DN2398_c1_g1_i2.p1 TRINITY_DN2398_c1_g1~~TRINITY_DN2398_c1_g1_i2.p1  ORF type:complete len:103 (-),score=4.36 TRINITY_DN2398_c1_g1_i2:146-427(-)